ncbi:MAG TPA: outer membrane protein assembly factor BamA, partial [candidate division Zixibacteria bacterium]|nr:outer membrane protein assembly factor BamA [candidate division Zixibacteria bacterium]
MAITIAVVGTCLSQTVSKVTVVGLLNASENLVITTSGLREGMPFTSAVVDDAIKRVYALGFFDDVVVRGRESGDFVEIEIEVEELPQVSQIVFEGNKRIADKDLLKHSGISLNDFLSPADAYYAVRKIKAEYADKGYPKVEIETEAIETQPGRVNLTFIIDEGVQLRVGTIEVFGNEAFSDGKLRRQIETKKKSLFRSGKFNEMKYLEDLEKIEEFYRNEGYIMASVDSDSVWTDTTTSRLNIQIWLTEGNKYYFGNTEITGYYIYDSTDIFGKLKYKAGDDFSEDILEQTQAEIYFLYQEKGYIYANVEEARRIDEDTVQVWLYIDEGIQAHVRKIEVAGNTRTHDKVIRREMAIYPGETFMRSKLMRSVRNVYYLNYFNDVVPDFKVLPDGDVDLIIDVEEKPIGRFQIGVTYNSRDKLVGNISVGWPNMLGRGWESEFMWEFGASRTNFSLSFTEPWFLDTPTTVGFDLYNTKWTWSGYYTESRTGGSVRLGRRLKWPDDYFSLYWRYKLESLSYGDFSSSYSPTPTYDLRERDWPELESSTRLTIQRDSRDSRMFATKGSRNVYSFDIAGEFLGGDVVYQKQDIRSEWFFPIHKYLTFVVKGRAGYLTNAFGDDQNDV